MRRAAIDILQIFGCVVGFFAIMLGFAYLIEHYPGELGLAVVLIVVGAIVWAISYLIWDSLIRERWYRRFPPKRPPLQVWDHQDIYYPPGFHKIDLTGGIDGPSDVPRLPPPENTGANK